MKITFLILLVSCTNGIWSTAVNQNVSSSAPCDSTIYCQGSLLDMVQMQRLFHDSKTFVDMKSKFSPNYTLEKFNYMNNNVWKKNPNKTQLLNFVTEHFESENNEFEAWIPSDWTENPAFIGNIKDERLKRWAIEINKIWTTLGRKIKDAVRLNPDQYSIIYVPNPLIIPGGRFREMYYWDSYWIIRGLLLCEMQSTAKGMIINYLLMIETFGLVPNGGRIYYSRRSQPPFLIPMVKSYFEITADKEFLRENIHLLEKELIYWMTNHTVEIEKKGKNYTLAIYKDSTTRPRPESYREDIIKGETLLTESAKQQFYSELKAAAESGWDFSSRWFILDGTNQGNITNVHTSSIVPVDLNSLLYWGAKIMSDFYRDLNVIDKAKEYDIIANKWRDAVTEVLWHEDVGAWLDFDLINKKRRDFFYPTNISPLWTGCYDKNNSDKFVSRVLKYLNKPGILDNKAGIPTTLVESKEQWDQPNAWPPLQYMTVMALDSTSNKEAQVLASKIAQKWICTNYLVYNATNKMYEKYQVNITGKEGKSNGEYPIQEGFGWTNGIILEFMQMYNSINITRTCIDTLSLEERCTLKMSNGDVCKSFFKNENINN